MTEKVSTEDHLKVQAYGSYKRSSQRHRQQPAPGKCAKRSEFHTRYSPNPLTNQLQHLPGLAAFVRDVNILTGNAFPRRRHHADLQRCGHTRPKKAGSSHNQAVGATPLDPEAAFEQVACPDPKLRCVNPGLVHHRPRIQLKLMDYHHITALPHGAKADHRYCNYHR